MFLVLFKKLERRTLQNELLTSQNVPVQQPNIAHQKTDIKYIARAAGDLVQKKSLPVQVSSDENPVDIPLYWLVNRDPYNGLV